MYNITKVMSPGMNPSAVADPVYSSVQEVQASQSQIASLLEKLGSSSLFPPDLDEMKLRAQALMSKLNYNDIQFEFSSILTSYKNGSMRLDDFEGLINALREKDLFIIDVADEIRGNLEKLSENIYILLRNMIQGNPITTDLVRKIYKELNTTMESALGVSRVALAAPRDIIQAINLLSAELRTEKDNPRLSAFLTLIKDLQEEIYIETLQTRTDYSSRRTSDSSMSPYESPRDPLGSPMPVILKHSNVLHDTRNPRRSAYIDTDDTQSKVHKKDDISLDAINADNKKKKLYSNPYAPLQAKQQALSVKRVLSLHYSPNETVVVPPNDDTAILEPPTSDPAVANSVVSTATHTSEVPPPSAVIASTGPRPTKPGSRTRRKSAGKVPRKVLMQLQSVAESPSTIEADSKTYHGVEARVQSAAVYGVAEDIEGRLKAPLVRPRRGSFGGGGRSTQLAPLPAKLRRTGVPNTQTQVADAVLGTTCGGTGDAVGSLVLGGHSSAVTYVSFRDIIRTVLSFLPVRPYFPLSTTADGALLNLLGTWFTSNGMAQPADSTVSLDTVQSIGASDVMRKLSLLGVKQPIVVSSAGASSGSVSASISSGDSAVRGHDSKQMSSHPPLPLDRGTAVGGQEGRPGTAFQPGFHALPTDSAFLTGVVEDVGNGVHDSSGRGGGMREAGAIGSDVTSGTHTGILSVVLPSRATVGKDAIKGKVKAKRSAGDIPSKLPYPRVVSPQHAPHPYSHSGDDSRPPYDSGTQSAHTTDSSVTVASVRSKPVLRVKTVGKQKRSPGAPDCLTIYPINTTNKGTDTSDLPGSAMYVADKSWPSPQPCSVSVSDLQQALSSSPAPLLTLLELCSGWLPELSRVHLQAAVAVDRRGGSMEQVTKLFASVKSDLKGTTSRISSLEKDVKRSDESSQYLSVLVGSGGAPEESVRHIMSQLVVDLGKYRARALAIEVTLTESRSIFDAMATYGPGVLSKLMATTREYPACHGLISEAQSRLKNVVGDLTELRKFCQKNLQIYSSNKRPSPTAAGYSGSFAADATSTFGSDWTASYTSGAQALQSLPLQQPAQTQECSILRDQLRFSHDRNVMLASQLSRMEAELDQLRRVHFLTPLVHDGTPGAVLFFAALQESVTMPSLQLLVDQTHSLHNFLRSVQSPQEMVSKGFEVCRKVEVCVDCVTDVEQFLVKYCRMQDDWKQQRAQAFRKVQLVGPVGSDRNGFMVCPTCHVDVSRVPLAAVVYPDPTTTPATSATTRRPFNTSGTRPCDGDIPRRAVAAGDVDDSYGFSDSDDDGSLSSEEGALGLGATRLYTKSGMTLPLDDRDQRGQTALAAAQVANGFSLGSRAGADEAASSPLFPSIARQRSRSIN